MRPTRAPSLHKARMTSEGSPSTCRRTVQDTNGTMYLRAPRNLARNLGILNAPDESNCLVGESESTARRSVVHRQLSGLVALRVLLFGLLKR